MISTLQTYFKFGIICLLLAAFVSPVVAQEEEVPVYTFLDFDGDGQSDTGLFENQADGSPNELVHQFELSSDESRIAEEYGKSTDFVAYGDYDGDGTWEITFVRDNETTLDWYTHRSSTAGATFGETNDIILSGCDFDRDGTTDRAVIRETSLLVQQSSDEEVTTTELELGESMAIRSALCVDLDGDDSLELLFVGSAIQTDSGKLTPLQKCKELYRGKKKRRKCRQGNKQIKEKNAEISSRIDILQVLDALGKEIYTTKAKKASSPVIADLDNDGTYEFGYFKYLPRNSKLHYFVPQTEEEVTTYSKEIVELPVNTRYVTFVKRDVEVDDSEGGEEEEVSEVTTESRDFLLLYDGDGLFSYFDLETLTVTEQFTTTLRGDELITGVNVNYTGSNVPEDPEGFCDSIEDFSDGPNGRVWKPSDHDGTAVFVRPVCDGRAKSVSVIKDGRTLAELRYAGLANPDSCGLREHWRHSKSPGSFPARSLVAVKMNGGAIKCYQLNDTPGKRND